MGSFQVRGLGLTAIFAAGLLLAGCGDQVADPAPEPEPAIAEPNTTDPLAAHVTLEDGDGYTRGLGEKAGALIEVIRPDAWNGDLVLLMHGIAPADAPITLRHPTHWQTQPAIDDLVARGYGVALSSYRKNGPAVAEGTIDTRIAQATFTSEFGRPERTYLWGWSMGGAVGHQLLEHAPSRYDGLLSVCSSQIGGIPQNEYQLDARLLFDYYFPGALPWAIGETNADLFTEVLPAIQAAFVADPAGYIEKVQKMAAIDQLQLPLGTGTPTEFILTILGSNLAFGGGGAAIIDAYDGMPVGNADRVYTSDVLSDAELADINAGIARFEADPNARRRVERLTPTGRTRGTPILALHTDGDAVVPVRFPQQYEEIAAATGNADSYALRVVPAFAHCELNPDLAPDGFRDIQIQAFDDLVRWVEDGVEPTP
ncbi:MAG: hypothetical protein ACODAA_09490 [Gemmatimonadota bacterium]